MGGVKKNFSISVSLLVGMLFVSLFQSSLSQGASAEAPVKRESQEKPKEIKKHILNFEDELVQGRAQKPELFYLLQKKNFNYKRLIRLREHFLPEMRQNSEMLNRNWNPN